ncbi:unnamed protein product [Rotaria sordida]|uniref:Calponin-homology (CH) domain-containing protein n=1 Tax=Rotaria sordida TaxID=392033 RepID=A0A814PUW1_9BILA|nr:unnamed protein product [Rotaria sordida]CAF1110706.1 unnamed protein product [Rotaria sordida]CAF1320020.1 unnamed protein product [Rotaria sordida]
MANYGPAYGTLASNLMKIATKRDPELDKEAQEWIESVIGEKFPNRSYEDALRDGIILCKLMNKLQPNAIPKFTTASTGFKLRENISLFQNAARAYGLLDLDLFQTVDLYEKRNIAQVTHCIFALSRQAQKKNFNGSVLRPHAPEFRPCEVPEKQLFAKKSLTGLLDEALIKFANHSD